MPDPGAPVAFDVIRRTPSQRAAGLICGMTGYRETAAGRFYQREAAPLRLPLIISLGSPFLIALGREPTTADRQPSFAAGLHAGPVHIESDGGAECVQVDFTPLGAYRFFGGAVVELAARMVDTAMSSVTKAAACTSASAQHAAGNAVSICWRILSCDAPVTCHRRRSHSPIGSWRRAAAAPALPHWPRRSAGAANTSSAVFAPKLA